MKSFYSLLLVVLTSGLLPVMAQTDAPFVVDSLASTNDSVVVEKHADILHDMPYVKVYMDKYVERYIRTQIFHIPMQAKQAEGFRVQVLNDNDPVNGRGRAEQLYQSLRTSISEPVYIMYHSPFWKVRVGDFKTMEDARDYRDRFVSLFPQLKTSTYIVKDKVQVLL